MVANNFMADLLNMSHHDTTCAPRTFVKRGLLRSISLLLGPVAKAAAKQHTLAP
jgi:hypothetical protein